MIGAVVAAALILVCVAVIAGRSGVSGAPRPAGGREERDRSERWARPRDIARLIVDQPSAERVVLGRLERRWVAAEPLASVKVTAPSGSGKTAGVVVPTVLRWQGAAVVTSVKSDVLALTLAQRRAQGPVWIFDPTGASGHTSCRWSPIAYAATYGGALRAAAWLVSSSKVEKRSSDDKELWDTLGKQLIAPALFAANRTGRHMSDVAQWLLFGLEDEVLEVLRGLGDMDAIGHWTAIMKDTERTKKSIYATARSILDRFTHPDVRQVLSPAADGDDTFSPDVLLDQGGTLYIVAPASEQEDFTPIFETLVNCVIREVERRHSITGLPISPRLLLMLDEAANCAPLRRLPTFASAGRGQGIQLVSIWQDDSQVETIYGPTVAATIDSNHVCKLTLPGVSDERTLERVSKLIGPHTVQRTTQGVGSDGRVTRSTQPHTEMLATPDYIRTIGRDEVIAIVSREAPMRLQVAPWYRDDHLRALIDPEVAARFDAEYGGLGGRKRKALR